MASWADTEDNKPSNAKMNKNWAELEEDGDDSQAEIYLPPPEIHEDEKNGTKTVIEYRIENGRRVKATSKFKVVTKTKKVSKKVS
jgi:hypothetical protein